MSTGTAERLEPAPLRDDFVLPSHITRGLADRGPRFTDMIWDLRPFLPRTAKTPSLDFTTLPDPASVRTCKEYMYSRLHRAVPGRGRSGGRAVTMKLSGAAAEFRNLEAVLAALRAVGAHQLSHVTKEHLEKVRVGWVSPQSAAVYISLLKHLADHGPFLSDRMAVYPWPGRSAWEVAGLDRDDENSTERIPEAVMGPFLAAAVFYVQVASHDIIAALGEVDRLTQARQARGRLKDGEGKVLLKNFIEHRRAQGRGIPARLDDTRANRPDEPVLDGVIQHANHSVIGLLVGLCDGTVKRYGHLLADAGEELGFEAGGLDTPMSIWPANGTPWRTRLDPTSLWEEVYHLRVACWTVIAYLSGMRDVEVRELRRDCGFTEPTDDGRIRYKLRGYVFKGRSLSGEQADWVVLDVVHEAVRVLLRINDDPTHLFGYFKGEAMGYRLLSVMPKRLNRYRDHLNELFSTPEALFVPDDVLVLPDQAEADDPQDAGSHDEEQAEDFPWMFNTRQFRRTLAWHIAHQPFGVVAGTRQYKHTRHVVFSGYAGTSASGFAAEVAAEEAAARLDYAEDLYRDWDSGGASAGGASTSIDADFARIRRELGDVPGVIASPARLRTMLAHLVKILHPGILNDCFFHSPTALCRKDAVTLGRPLPLLNTCLNCPNARRSSVHLPRLTTARHQADLFLDPAPPNGQLLQLQKIALDSHIADLDQAISTLQPAAARRTQ
jgi:hypothetical protein